MWQQNVTLEGNGLNGIYRYSDVCESKFVFYIFNTHFKQMTDMLLYIIDLPDAMWETTKQVAALLNISATSKLFSKCVRRCHCKHTIFWVVWRKYLINWKNPFWVHTMQETGLGFSHREVTIGLRVFNFYF